jgi:hypothetical protein
MATFEIQTLTDGQPHYSTRANLDGTDYQFTFRFGDRRECWVFDMATLDGEEVISGQIVIVAADLLRRAPPDSRPPGLLFALNLQDDGQGHLRELAGLYDLGQDGRMRLYYREADVE